MTNFRVVLWSFLTLAIFVGALEFRLAQRGIEPTVFDTLERWGAQRQRASDLGRRALILVGASRIQLAADLGVLRSHTGLEPVQLAIDGSSPLPVLDDLAADASITGTVVVDYYGDMFDTTKLEAAKRYLESRKHSQRRAWFDDAGDRFEATLTALIRDHLRIYADGGTPFNAWQRAFLSGPPQSYLIMAADRSRRADYQRLPMPQAYYARVIATLSEKLDPRAPGIEDVLAGEIARLRPADNRTMVEMTPVVARAVATIRQRGGDVVFLKMPTSGMVKEIEQRRFPPEMYWKPFLEAVRARGLPDGDLDEWMRFECPDGSHLDYRDQARFSLLLARALVASSPDRSALSQPRTVSQLTPIATRR